jgi:biotin carboxylase
MRILLLSHTTGYQLRAFNDAAEQLGIELVFATDRCHRLDDPWQDRAVAVRFHELGASVAAIVARLSGAPVSGLIAVGDRPVPLAARAAETLGIPWHSVAGADASTDKRHARAALALAGLPVPRFAAIAPSARARRPSAVLGLPSFNLRPPYVLKPAGLSGSRGVIRANDAREFDEAFARIRALLARPQIRAARSGLDDEILVEEYIEGAEFAIEGVMTAGRLQLLAFFDKPDPLTGPFFEETIYATPSTLPADAQGRIVDSVQRAALALRLRHGPIHAECRVTSAGDIYVLEAAARPIGGLCSRVLTFADPRAAGRAAESLESVLIRHAIGEDVSAVTREAHGAAVMMIPIPRRGNLRAISGDAEAREVPGVTEIRITAKIGQLIEPLPEAGSYLGFIFARGATARDAEAAVRAAHRLLVFDVAKEITVVR